MLERIIEGGFMMIPLLACSLLALAAILDRGLAFYQNGKVDVRGLRATVLRYLDDGRLDDAILLCASTPGPVPAVMLVGLQAYRKLAAAGEEKAEVRARVGKAMDDFSLHAMSAVQRRFNVLAMVGNSAPLFGMAGTVTGMIGAFQAMSNAAALDASMVAGGISEALITTAAGLLIALAAVIPLGHFRGMAQEIELEIEDANAELVEFVSSQG
jgi:biopolymer transport protein ExbB